MKPAVLVPPVTPDPGVGGQEGLHTVLRGLCGQLAEHGSPPRLILPDYVARSGQKYPSVSISARYARGIREAAISAAGPTTRQLVAELVPLLADHDVCIAYDVLFDVYLLPLTTALVQAADETGCPLVFYSYECTWDASRDGGFDWSRAACAPWDAIRRAAGRHTLAFPATATRDKIAGITGIELPDWSLLPPLLDLAWEPHLNDEAVTLWSDYQLWDCDSVMFLPGLNRMNNGIDRAMRVLRALKDRGLRSRLLLTYSRDNWYPGNRQHYDELIAAATALGLRDDVIFLASARPSWANGLDRHALQTVYQLCDAVLLLSDWEGFGLVAVEAVLARAPLFCTDLPVLREVTGNCAEYFQLDAPEHAIADRVAQAMGGPGARARKAIAPFLDREAHYRRFIEPMLARAADL